MEEPELQNELRKGFEDVINRHCGENEANVPDFILADYLVRCFNVFNNATKQRDKWYSVKLEPANSHFTRGDKDHEELMGAVARGWGHEKNSAKEMDIDLSTAISDEVEKYLNSY